MPKKPVKKSAAKKAAAKKAAAKKPAAKKAAAKKPAAKRAAKKPAAKKPRAKKPVPVEKVVRKLKYLKNFKLEKLELESVSPTKLHGCSEAWVYDTKKRKLHHYVADEYTKALGVKGNTVLGFCTKESGIKTLRKPEEQIKEIMGSKPAARKFFDNIKAVAATPNGRFNANMIILRAF